MSKTTKIVAAVVVIFALLALGTCTGVLTPDTSAPTYGNDQNNGGN